MSLGRVGAKRRDELVFATPQTARVATQHEASETEELARFIQGDCKLQLAQLIAACNPAELSELSQALLTTYSTWPGGSETLIAWATRKHVAECSQPETLFRGTCLETKVISAYVHKECSDFVRAAVTPLLRWLRERNLALEVDPAKEPSADALQRNQALVLEGAELILSTILQNTALIPEHVSSVLRSIQSIVERKFSDMGVRSVGALLFLRLICPAMVSPDHFLGFRDSTPQLRHATAWATVTCPLTTVPSPPPRVQALDDSHHQAGAEPCQPGHVRRQGGLPDVCQRVAAALCRSFSALHL